MDERGFKKWLEEKYKKTVAQSRFANCKTVEQAEGDLDVHFAKDKGINLLKVLAYSTEDQRNNRNPLHSIIINGDKRTGSATYKQAINLYFNFKSGIFPEQVSNNYETSIRIENETLKTDWPEWIFPSDYELIEVLRLTAKYAKFLNPYLVEQVVIDNNKNKEKWIEKLKSRKINPEIYLWENSSCAFPGVRRFAGSKEIAFYRKHKQIEAEEIHDAVRLDDNDFPKQIWSIIFRGKPFAKFGPSNFALAHLADHKNHNNRMFDEFEVIDSDKNIPLFGLYTCPSNTVFIPTSLLRPTDFSPFIRRILIEKANDLYGNFCNILPQHITFSEKNDHQIKFSDLEWSEPVGEIKYLNDFLKFRSEKMNQLLG